MKKVLLLALALTIVLGLTACGADFGDTDMTDIKNVGGGTYVQNEEYTHSGTVEGGEYPRGDEPVSWFDAEVLSVYDGSILVLAHEESWVRHRCADQLYITTKLYSGETLSGFEVGDLVRITYNGMIAENYPAQIFTVYDIEMIEVVE